jgi:hypothetical protein
MATFGNLSTGTTPTDNPSTNTIWVKALTTPASNGTLTSISVYGNILSGTPTLGVALYSDNAGVPNARLAQEVTTMGSFAAGFGVVTTNLSVAVVSGVQYWFGLLALGGDGNIHWDSSGGATELFFQPLGQVFPATMSGASSDATERWSVFGTYTPSGAAPLPQLGRNIYVMP